MRGEICNSAHILSNLTDLVMRHDWEGHLYPGIIIPKLDSIDSETRTLRFILRRRNDGDYWEKLTNTNKPSTYIKMSRKRTSMDLQVICSGNTALVTTIVNLYPKGNAEKKQLLPRRISRILVNNEPLNIYTMPVQIPYDYAKVSDSSALDRVAEKTVIAVDSLKFALRALEILDCDDPDEVRRHYSWR